MLDTFCYSGGFSIAAAKGGASHVTAVDSSDPALSLARRNTELNGVSELVTFEQADVLDYLVRAAKEEKTFDIVILDPPKLAPSRKDLDRAKGKYKKLQKAGLACVAPGGLLVTCTCSSAMAQNNELLPVIRAAASGDDARFPSPIFFPISSSFQSDWNLHFCPSRSLAWCTCQESCGIFVGCVLNLGIGCTVRRLQMLCAV